MKKRSSQPISYAQAMQLMAMLDDFVTLTPAEKAIILPKVRFISVRRNTNLVEVGQVCTTMWFVLKGCLRLYYTRANFSEVNGFFFYEGLFTSAFSSFMQQIPSRQTLRTVEDCDLLFISHQEFEELYELVPNMNRLVRVILQERYTHAHNIIESFVLDTPEDRYLNFQRRYKQIANRLPQKDIASYIGVTPQSLSRMVKRLQSHDQQQSHGPREKVVV